MIRKYRSDIGEDTDLPMQEVSRRWWVENENLTDNWPVMIHLAFMTLGVATSCYTLACWHGQPELVTASSCVLIPVLIEAIKRYDRRQQVKGSAPLSSFHHWSLRGRAAVTKVNRHLTADTQVTVSEMQQSLKELQDVNEYLQKMSDGLSTYLRERPQSLHASSATASR